MARALTKYLITAAAPPPTTCIIQVTVASPGTRCAYGSHVHIIHAGKKTIIIKKKTNTLFSSPLYGVTHESLVTKETSTVAHMKKKKKGFDYMQNILIINTILVVLSSATYKINFTIKRTLGSLSSKP